MDVSPKDLRDLAIQHERSGNRPATVLLLRAAADEIERLRAALLEAVEWNWLDDDMPEDVQEKVYAVIRNFQRAKSAEQASK